jgi:predicted dehydrogenase
MVALFGAPEGVQSTVVMLPSGVDGHGAVNLAYGDGMIATVLYSKMVDMSLPWEIEGEDGTIRGDAINAIRRVEFRPRDASHDAEKAGAASGGWIDITNPEHCGNDYAYEIAHFIDLVQARTGAGAIESPINTHATSIATLEIVDRIRQQSGISYPADR